MFLYLLLIIPWLLTVGALLYIMFVQGNDSYIEDEELLPEDLLSSREKGFVPPSNLTAAIVADKAYWVYNNVFYEAEVIQEPDWETAKPVDVDKLSQKELDNLMGVLDDIKDHEG